MRQEVLAEAAGEFQTPCYVFDLDRLREDVAEMKTLQTVWDFVLR